MCYTYAFGGVVLKNYRVSAEDLIQGTTDHVQ
jgi:hypothetical protein